MTSPDAEQPLLLVSPSEKNILLLVETAKLALASYDLPAGRQELEKKQIQSGNHPDIFTIIGENNTVYMKHIEALKPLLSHRAKKRLVIIPHADHILSEGTSALLKVLEEPSSATRFLLGAQSQRGIIPTLRSRCRVLFVGGKIAADVSIHTDALLQQLSELRRPDSFSEEDLRNVALLIHHMAKEGIASGALFRVAKRLKDYYKIAAIPGGNTKLAADILLASLANLRNTVLYANHTSRSNIS